jgi:hypothetical protein
MTSNWRHSFDSAKLYSIPSCLLRVAQVLASKIRQLSNLWYRLIMQEPYGDRLGLFDHDANYSNQNCSIPIVRVTPHQCHIVVFISRLELRLLMCEEIFATLYCWIDNLQVMETSEKAVRHKIKMFTPITRKCSRGHNNFIIKGANRAIIPENQRFK